MKETLLRRLWGLRRPRRLWSVLIRRLGISHWFTVRTRGVRLRFFPAMTMIYLVDDPTFCSRDVDLLRRWLRRGDVVVDCGANIGLHALVASSVVGPEGKVYAVEAHPTTFRYLSENAKVNGAANLRVLHAAVGEREGSITFSDQYADDGNHIVPRGAGIAVQMLPVDAIVPPGTNVRLLKLDVEGYEKFALHGAARTLQDTACVYFESSDLLFGRYDYTCREIFALLESAGFTLLRYASDFEFERVPTGYHSTEIENLVAVRNIEEFRRVTGYTVR